jgi:uncharacterized protein with HEPN domain
MEKDINNSIKLINKRIKNIKITDRDFEEKIIPIKYYIESLKLNFIEIGEEANVLNKILKQIKDKKEEEISNIYNFRISLTHYYTKIDNRVVLKFKKERFPKFIDKIKQLEKEFGGKN